MTTDVLDASDLSRSDPLAACHAAQLLRDRGDLTGALAELTRATGRFPKSGLVWADRAAVLVLLGQEREAVSSARRARELLPESAVPWDVLGDAYSRLDRLGRALDCWERALELGTHTHRRKVQAKIDRGEKRLAREARAWRAFTDRSRAKVWAIRVEGRRLTIRYGDLGESGRRQAAELPSARAALRHAEKLIAAKRREGYRQVRRKDGQRGRATSLRAKPQGLKSKKGRPAKGRYREQSGRGRRRGGGPRA